LAIADCDWWLRIVIGDCGFLGRSTIRNAKSTIRKCKSTIRNANQQSAMEINNPQSKSTIGNPNRQSAIQIDNRQSPKSAIINPKSPFSASPTTPPAPLHR
jgi:hypothetical protein